MGCATQISISIVLYNGGTVTLDTRVTIVCMDCRCIVDECDVTIAGVQYDTDVWWLLAF